MFTRLARSLNCYSLSPSTHLAVLSLLLLVGVLQFQLHSSVTFLQSHNLEREM